MLKVYGMSLSGNCYKVRLLLNLLGRPVEWIETDTRKNETRSAEFLAKNPAGQVPLLELEDGRFLSESNAILYYLAAGSQYFSTEPFEAAGILKWMFFEQYSHEPYIAVNRADLTLFKRRRADDPVVQARLEKGNQALAVIDNALATADYLAGRFSIADIALYAYTHVAHEGGFNLDEFAGIKQWLGRIEEQPGYVAITAPV